jgi:opacity protein-like surface antigen
MKKLTVLIAVAAASLAAPAAASAEPASPGDCTAPALTQPFTAWKDSAWYTLAPGQSSHRFDGRGWTLTGGATVRATTLGDGSQSTVLDLPSGSKAVSPAMCVTKAFPRARSMVRNVKGSEGVFFYVSYLGTKTWDTPKNTGQFHGSNTSWTLSGGINLQPLGTTEWQVVRFTFVPGGNTSDFQLYDFYVDPRRN